MGGEIDEESKKFFSGKEVVASEAIRFFAEKGKFRKPDEKRLKELREMGENEKAAIEIIQRLPLGAVDRVELLLCYLGKKTATTFINEKQPIHPDLSAGFTELLQKKEGEIKKWLKEIDLTCEIVDNWEETTTKGETKLFQLIHVGKNKKVVERLVKAWNEDDDKKIGLLYGYPETAIDAWVKGVQEIGRRPPLGESWDNPYALKRSEIPHKFSEEKRDKIKNIVKFANFNFSKEHWQQELDELKIIAGTIKKKSPELYEEFLSSQDL